MSGNIRRIKDILLYLSGSVYSSSWDREVTVEDENEILLLLTQAMTIAQARMRDDRMRSLDQLNNDKN
jgi:hypothetical protein